MVNKMMEKIDGADAVITIEGKKYALYKNGPLKNYPYIVDTSTGKIPQGRQRSLLKTYLQLNGMDVDPSKEQGPHWYVQQAIKVAQGKGLESILNDPSLVLSPDKPYSATERNYLPLTEENIDSIHQQAIASRSYGTNLAIIHDVLKRFPQNNDHDLVAMKVALIDLTNSTNISKYINRVSLSEIVELILHIRDFDLRISQGDPSVVSQLAKSNGNINLFSFASKYCTYHNAEVYERDDYSIFDNVVRDALPHYVSGLAKSAIMEWRRAYDYAAFNRCIGEILAQKNIHIPFRRRKFDQFLWYVNHTKEK